MPQTTGESSISPSFQGDVEELGQERPWEIVCIPRKRTSVVLHILLKCLQINPGFFQQTKPLHLQSQRAWPAKETRSKKY